MSGHSTAGQVTSPRVRVHQDASLGRCPSDRFSPQPRPMSGTHAPLVRPSPLTARQPAARPKRPTPRSAPGQRRTRVTRVARSPVRGGSKHAKQTVNQHAAQGHQWPPPHTRASRIGTGARRHVTHRSSPGWPRRTRGGTRHLTTGPRRRPEIGHRPEIGQQRADTGNRTPVTQSRPATARNGQQRPSALECPHSRPAPHTNVRDDLTAPGVTPDDSAQLQAGPG